MDFVSTRGQAPPASFREALFRGLAPDGGLYMPRKLPILSPAALAGFGEKDWPEVAAAVTNPLLFAALEDDRLEALAAEAFDFPLPLIQLRENLFVLELFRGPTLAFKDVGARYMARLLAECRADGDPVITILTATSGDTGGAVAHAFHGRPGMRVVVLFPDGKVSPRQERQFSTLGGNVTALAVQGDFDACQRLTKEAFLEEAAQRSPPSRPEGRILTSANSINLGRFLPQCAYFFEAWARLQARNENRTHILFSVPSGNFGNLAAGLMAKAMGLPDVSFLAATNMNDVVPEYLVSGRFVAKPSTRTLSTAMDVGNPSGLARILHLSGGSVEALRLDLVGRRVTDPETRECIQRVHQETGYVLDPHSAVGFVALEEALAMRRETTGVLLATAHPAKFAEVVEPLLGHSLPVPPQLADCLRAERMVTPLEPTLAALSPILRC